MKQSFLVLLLWLAMHPVQAQDTLWIKQGDGTPYLVHRVSSGGNAVHAFQTLLCSSGPAC
jgi:hypothetical protein